MHYAIHSRSITRLANRLLLLLGCAVCSTLSAGQTAPGIYVDQVSTNLALEIRVGHPIGDNMLLYGGLYNNGSDNMLEFKILGASTTGVSIEQDLGDVDSGQIFALSDWCFSANYAVMPYIRDFDVHVLRYDLNNDSFETLLVAASQASQYTNTDCMSFDLGMTTGLVIPANNFDDKGIDYYQSDDGGANWDLRFEYRLDDDTILDGFGGGFLDDHVAIDNDTIGSTYQRGNGWLESVRLDLGGTVLNTGVIFNGSDLIDNGELMELDSFSTPNISIPDSEEPRACFIIGSTGLRSDDESDRSGRRAFAHAILSSFFNVDPTEVGGSDVFANAPDSADAVFDFTGVSVTYRLSPDVTGQLDLFGQTNTLTRINFDPVTQQYQDPVEFSDWLFRGNGGPAELVYANFGTVGRLLSFGVSNENLRDSAGFLGGTFVATIDTATAVTEPVQPVLGLPSGLAVPLLNRQMLLLMLLLIAAVGAITLARRSG